MSAILFFRPLFLAERGRFAATLLLALVALGAGVALLGLSGWFLTGASLATAALSFNLFAPSAAVRGLSFLRIGARYGEKLVGHDATLRVLGTIRAWLFRRLMPRVGALRPGLRRGDLVSRLTADVDALDTAFLLAVGPLLGSLLVGAAMVLALAILLPDAALVYAAGWTAATLLVPALFVRASHRGGAAAASVEAAAMLRVACLDAIDGHADIVAFGARPRAEARFAERARRLAALRKSQGRRAARAGAAIQALAGATLLGTLVLGLRAHGAGEIGGALMVGLLLAILASFEASAAVMRSVARLAEAEAAAKRLREAATSPEAMVEPADPVPLPPGGAVAFEGVRFGHRADRPVLRNLDLCVPAGAQIAVRGASGAGKSTLLHLLLRLAEPQAGRIRLAGADIAAVKLADLHARVALLEQNAPVFLDTVRGNLLVGRADAGEAELWDALDRARLGDAVRAMPRGLDTELGESGRTLSAGQARRLGLARVLLSRAAVLALDEPTSGLDREAELAFLRDLRSACAGRTVLLVTHAETEPGFFDRQYRLVDGRLLPDQ